MVGGKKDEGDETVVGSNRKKEKLLQAIGEQDLIDYGNKRKSLREEGRREWRGSSSMDGENGRKRRRGEGGREENGRGMGGESLLGAPVLLLIAAVLVQGRYLSAWNGAGCKWRTGISFRWLLLVPTRLGNGLVMLFCWDLMLNDGGFQEVADGCC